MTKLKNLELILLAAVLGLLALAILGPDISQPAHQHVFADQRMWRGIPFAMDVLSNLSFAAWGLAGIVCLFGLLVRTRLNTEHALTVRWGLVIFVYVVAKLLELADHQIYELTSHAISGHSLKHLAASFAAWPVLTTVLAAFGKTQNQGRIHVIHSDGSTAH